MYWNDCRQHRLPTKESKIHRDVEDVRTFTKKVVSRLSIEHVIPHYKHSGYDRGHMAPAADFNSDDALIADTYNLGNIVPQDHTMNISLWSRLEEWTRQVAVAHNESLMKVNHDVDLEKDMMCGCYVVTGPLWLPHRQVSPDQFEYSITALGKPPSLVAVPTHLFKVVVVVTNDDTGNIKSSKSLHSNATGAARISHFACFVVPNRPPPNHITEDKSTAAELQDYLVSWTDLEAVTGLQLFPQWTTSDWKVKADQRFRSFVATTGSNSDDAREYYRSALEQPLLTASSMMNGTPMKTTLNTKKKNGSRAHRKKALPPSQIQHLCENDSCRRYPGRRKR